MSQSIIVAISTVANGSMLVRDDPTNPRVLVNRERFLGAHGIAMEQTTRFKVAYDRDNFCEYREVGSHEKGAGMRDGNTFIADAITTTSSGHALMLPVADCVGTILYDPVQKVLMLSHLGRHSLEQDGGKKSVQYLVQQYGSRPKDLRVWLTPAPGKDVYPIWALDNKGMKEATFEQLQAAGIVPHNITDSPIDTDKDPNYFSHSEFLKGHRDEDGDHLIIAMMTDEQ